ncbi:MAG TPA: hypothetical protein VLV83_25020 [Acidobacteriota bacterium]|nr:hypothetical protein [Acidobacteriota bacterium]
MKLKATVASAVVWAWLAPLAAQAVRTVPLDSFAMAYSPSRNQLYVAVAKRAAQRPGTVTIVNPLSGAIGASLPLEADAWTLAITHDERYLYAGLVGGLIARIDLRTFTRDLTISTAPSGVEDRVIVEIHPFPDRPGSFVASVAQNGLGPYQAVLAVFDGDAMRPRVAGPGLGVVRFAFGADSSTIWGHNSADTGFDFYGFAIDDEGISVVTDPYKGLYFGFLVKLLFRDGLLYTSNGRVVDPSNRSIEGRYYSFEALFARSFDIDWARERVYFPSRSGYDFYLAEFDLRTFRRLGDFVANSSEVRVPWTPEQTFLCGSVLVMGGYGPEYPFITLFPTSLIRPVSPWQRPPQQPLSDELRRIPLENNTIVYDARRNRILASTPNWASTIGNSLLPIDPVSGRVGDPVWIGSDPWQMAISDDGQFLYAGLYSGWAVQRVRLQDLSPDLRVPLYAEDDWGWGRLPTRVNQVLPYPGRPESFVVVRAAGPGAGPDLVPQGIAVYDGPAQRHAATGELPFENQVWWAQWDTSGQALYAFPNFGKVAVHEEGVDFRSSTRGAAQMVQLTDLMGCQYDLCFTPSGDVIDGRSEERLGRFAFDPYDRDYWPAEFIVPDLDRGLVYFLSDVGKVRYGDWRLHVEAFHLPSFERVGHFFIENAAPPTGFLMWGSDQMAVSTWDEVVLFPLSKLHSRPHVQPPVAEDLRSPVRWVFPFVEQDYRRFTGFAVSNPVPESVQLGLIAYSADGDPNPIPNNRQQLNLLGGQQWSRLGSEIFNWPYSLSNMWFELGGDNPALPGGFFLTQHGDGLDGAVAQNEPPPVLYFPRVVSGENRFRGRTPRSELHLVNPNGYAVRVKLTLTGTVRSPSNWPKDRVYHFDLPAYGSTVEELRQRNSTVDYLSAHIKVEVDQERGSLIGFQIIRLEGEPETLVAFNAITPSEATALFSAQLAHGPGIFTNLKLVNTSDQARHIVLTAVADNGSLLAQPVDLALEAGDALDEDVDVLFAFAPSVLVTGSLRVEANGPGVIGNVLFGEPHDLDFASALNLESAPFREAVFSHLANLEDFFTGLALYNPSDENAQVTLEVYTAEGVLSGSTGFVLPQGARLSRLLTELVPATEGQAGGYIRLRATQPVVGQQLFGNTALTHLASVPAQRME